MLRILCLVTAGTALDAAFASTMAYGVRVAGSPFGRGRDQST